MAENDDDELFGIERKKALIGLGLAAALSVGAVALLGQITSYHQLLQALHRANKPLLPLCIAGQIVAYIGYVVAYRTVAHADGGPIFRLWTAARIVGLGLGAYVVGSAAGGLGVDFWAMRQAGAKIHEAARRTLALNTLQAFGLTGFAFLSGVYLLATGTHRHTAFVFALVWVVVVPAALAASWFVSSPSRAKRFATFPGGEERPSTWSPLPWLKWLWAKARKALADAIGGVVLVRHVVRHPLRYLGGVIGYPLFWLGDFATLYIALRAFGVSLSPPRLIVAEAAAWALTFLPLPGGGSGVAEASMSFALHGVGVPLSPAIFAALVYRATNFWLPIVPALALLQQVPKLQEELPNVEHAEPDDDAPVHVEQVGDGDEDEDDAGGREREEAAATPSASGRTQARQA
jgi:uncharacterized protein (TIRG00374 family)